MKNVNRDMESKKSSNKFMRMTINWIALLHYAGFHVSDPQDAINDRAFVEISYKGRKVLEKSNYGDFYDCFYLKSFVEYLDAEEIPDYEQSGDEVKITSKSDLVKYLESLREKVYPDLNKINVIDMLLDTAQDA